MGLPPNTPPHSDGHRAADRLFRAFEEQINSGALRVGDTLPTEREIVATYGVSRTVAREAVLALANKGLVEAKPRFRPVVIKPSYDTAMRTVDNVVGRLLRAPGGVANLFDSRTLLEAALVRAAALNCDKAGIAALQHALDENGAAVENSEEFYATDMAFHRVLYEVTGNPVFPAVHNAYFTWLAPHWSNMPRLPERNRINYLSHQKIFEAILHRDPDAAETALRQHLADAWDQVKETFSDL